MEIIKKYWMHVLLFMIFFNVGYFSYKYKDSFKPLFSLNQRVVKIENSVKDLSNKMDGLKDFVEKNLQKPEDKPAEKNQRRKRPDESMKSNSSLGTI